MVVKAVSDNSINVLIWHLVIDGSSQRVVGKNVTKYANIIHADQNAVGFQVDGVAGYFSTIEHEFLIYIPLDAFAPNSSDETALTCLNSTLSGNWSWKQTKAVIDKVHRHVCGHASFTDKRLLFERKNLWYDMVANCVAWLVKSCAACCLTVPLQLSRKVSISSLSRSFNEVICIYHVNLESICDLHGMHLATRYSAAQIACSTSIDQVVFGFESAVISQFWIPKDAEADSGFSRATFQKYFRCHNANSRLATPQRHSRNPLGSQHGIIRSISLKF